MEKEIGITVYSTSSYSGLIPLVFSGIRIKTEDCCSFIDVVAKVLKNEGSVGIIGPLQAVKIVNGRLIEINSNNLEDFKRAIIVN